MMRWSDMYDEVFAAVKVDRRFFGETALKKYDSPMKRFSGQI